MTSIVAVARRARLMSVTAPIPPRPLRQPMPQGRLVQTGTDGGGAERRTRRDALELANARDRAECCRGGLQDVTRTDGIGNLAIRSSAVSQANRTKRLASRRRLKIFDILRIPSSSRGAFRINAGWVTHFTRHR
jgi:hypothetical protein